ncbi:hypothetical protein [Paenibacillus gansuensis]|uniref:Uncharacterized protein n=1 Tax=Paenibacillus gansuensis TaxID=306542 RepID=A0ABW5PHX3_9BACL
MDAIETILSLIKDVKANPEASLIFTIIGGILVWLFKKSESVLVEKEKTKEAKEAQKISQYYELESFLALYLQDPAANRDKLIEKLGSVGAGLSEALRARMTSFYLNPSEQEARGFLSELQVEIGNIRANNDLGIENELLSTITGRGIILTMTLITILGSFALMIGYVMLGFFIIGILTLYVKTANTVTEVLYYGSGIISVGLSIGLWKLSNPLRGRGINWRMMTISLLSVVDIILALFLPLFHPAWSLLPFGITLLLVFWFFRIRRQEAEAANLS